MMALGVQSCYKNVEGCIDPESTNYAIAADILCEDCCTYPKIKLNVFHQNADTTLFLGDTITNNLGQEYKILKYAYLLSDFQMQTSDEEVHEVTDRIALDDMGKVVSDKDDVIRINRSGFSYELGTIIFDGIGDQLSFVVGVEGPISTLPFSEVIAEHPLTTDPDSLYSDEDEMYTSLRIRIAQGPSFEDTIVYNLTETSMITFPLKFESVRGADKTLIIEAQYDKLFTDVDFTTMTTSQVQSKMQSNVVNIFGARL